MQNLDVISVNIWQILISLANLVLLFLILKKFLYRPVKEVLAARQRELDERYEAARKAEDEAKKNRELWDNTISKAKDEASDIIRAAADNAKRRSETIVSAAEARADGILRKAKEDARLERERAASNMKREIAEVSSAISEKLLKREINDDDHRSLINWFIDNLEN